MINLLSNQWVVGIGGGVLSGLLVTLITRKYFASKDNREYFQKIRLANSEILYAIKPFIIDGEVPSKEVIFSFQIATARKHAVDLKDVGSINEIVENLTKEVMDSSFISSSAKNEYCKKLIRLKPEETESEEIEKHKTQAITEYRHRVLSAFSMLLGVFAGLLTAYVGFIYSTQGTPLVAKLQLLLPSFLAFIMAYFAVTFLKLAKRKDAVIDEDVT